MLVKPSKNPDSNTLYLKCECSTHLLEVSRDDWDADSPSVNLVIWAFGREGDTLPLFSRFRWIWQVLTTGSLWGDSVILNLDKAKQLTNFLRRVVYKKYYEK